MHKSLMGRLQESSTDITDAMQKEIVTHIEVYGRLTREGLRLLHDEIQEMVDLSLTRMCEGRPYADHDLDLPRRQGERRAFQGFGADDLARAHALGAIAANRHFWAVVRDRDWLEVAPISSWLAGEMPRAAAASQLGYAVGRASTGALEPARTLLAEHLLSGRSSRAVAEAAGLSLAKSYLVFACPAAGLRNLAGMDQAAVFTRIARIPGALAHATRSRLTVLLPAEGTPHTARDAAGQLLAGLSALLPGPLPAAIAWRPRCPEVTEAAEEAWALLDVLSALPDVRTRVYEKAELLLERSLTTRPGLVNELSALLEPLRTHGELLDTIAALLDHDLDREATARALNVHRRTVTYRLTRVRDLTGIDSRTAQGISLLRTALIATRLQ